MRLVIKKYACDGLFSVETTNDGGSVVRELGGCRDVGQRISAYLEGTCDDTEEGVDRLLSALSWLREEVEKRRKRFSGKKAKKKKAPA
jgi:hypothetical protein